MRKMRSRSLLPWQCLQDFRKSRKRMRPVRSPQGQKILLLHLAERDHRKGNRSGWDVAYDFAGAI